MRIEMGRSVVPAKAGIPKVLFQRLKWIPAFAGMTLRGLAEGCNFDFFTRSFAGMTAGRRPPPYTQQVNGQHFQLAVLLDILSPGQPYPLPRRIKKARLEAALSDGTASDGYLSGA